MFHVKHALYIGMVVCGFLVLIGPAASVFPLDEANYGAAS